MTLAAVLYSRISRDDEGDNISLQTQQLQNEALAQRLGATVVASFSEDFSGMKLDERAELTKARKLIRSGKANCLIVHKSDRLTRSPGHGEVLLDELYGHNARFFASFNGKEYVNSSDDRMMFVMETAFNRRWRDMAIEAMHRGKSYRIENGMYLGLGTAPFGYVKGKSGKYNILLPNPTQILIVQDIYDMYVVQDMSTSQIAKYLYGTPSPQDLRSEKTQLLKKRAYGEWKDGTIRLILKNELYAGIYWQMWKGQRYAYTVDPIIPREIYEAAQQKLIAGRKTFFGITKYEYLMAKRLICEKCGHVMFGHTKTQGEWKWQRYECSSSKREVADPFCGTKSFSVAHVDNAIWQWVIDLFEDPRSLRGKLEASQAAVKENNAEQHANIARLKATQEKLIARLDAIVDQTLDNPPPLVAEALRRKQRETQEAFDDLQAEIEQAESRLQTVSITDETIRDIEKVAKQLKGKLDNATFEQKRRVIDLLDLKAALAIENGTKIVYLKWNINMFTLPLSDATSSNTVALWKQRYAASQSPMLTFRLVLSEEIRH